MTENLLNRNVLPVVMAWLLAFQISSVVAAPPSIEMISKSPFILNAAISPSGSYFAARLSDDPKRAFGVFRWSNGALTPIIQAQELEELFIERFWWLSDDTLLIRMGRLGGRKAQIRVDGRYERYHTGYGTALYIFDAGQETPDGAKPLRLLTDDGSLVSELPNDPDHILISKGSRSSPPTVYRVNIREDKKWETVQKKERNISDWSADRAGKVRLGYGYNYGGDRKIIVKIAGSDKFQDLSHLVDDVDKRFFPLAFAEELNHLYVASNHETDTLSLYLFDIERAEFLEQIYHNPSFDVSDVYVHSETGSLQGVSFEAEETETVWFDDGFKREVADIGLNFPGRTVDIISFSDDAQFSIVEISAQNFPGQYYIYDRGAKQLFPLPEQHSALRKEMLGLQLADTYLARDGAEIPAFVTLPPGVNSLADAKNIPFVIMPHGGPAARDFVEFDMWVQFYAMHGYGVLQMNFRGSEGYGLSFELAGRQQWGKLMQDDITDGVHWLIDKAYADPNRIAIVGASYGGYAALMGAVKTPNLFQCAVSFAGVSNLFGLVQNADKDSYARRAIGNIFTDADDLRQNSPYYRAEDFGIPVLLLHGRLDGIVSYGQSQALYDNLRRFKKPVEFVTMPQSGHGIYNDYDDRVLFFKTQKDYIHGCLGEEL